MMSVIFVISLGDRDTCKRRTKCLMSFVCIYNCTFSSAV